MDNLSKLNEIIKKYQEGGEITEVIELPEVVVRAQSLQSKYGEEFDAENNFYNFVYGKPQTNTSTFKSRQDEYNKRRDRHISNALVDKVITDSRGGTLDNVYNTYGKETYDYIINNTSNSQIAGNVYDEFVSGFKHLSNNMLNDDYTSLEEKKYNASNPITSQLGSLGKMLSPLSVPYNATVGGAYTNIQGEENYSTWDGLSGNIPKNRNSQLEIFSDPLNFVGIGAVNKIKGLNNIDELSKLNNLYKDATFFERMLPKQKLSEEGRRSIEAIEAFYPNTTYLQDINKRKLFNLTQTEEGRDILTKHVISRDNTFFRGVKTEDGNIETIRNIAGTIPPEKIGNRFYTKSNDLGLDELYTTNDVDIVKTYADNDGSFAVLRNTPNFEGNRIDWLLNNVRTYSNNSSVGFTAKAGASVPNSPNIFQFSGKPNEKILDVVDVLNINNFKKNKFYPTSQGSSFTGELPDKYKVESVLKNYKEKGGLINEEEMSNYKEQLNSILGKFQSGGKVSKTSIDFLRNFLYKNSKDSDQGLIWRFQREYGNSKPVTENDIISFQGSWQLDPKNRPKPRSRDYTPMPQVKKSSVSTYNKGKGGYSEEDLNFLTDTLYKGKGYSQEQALMQFDSEYGGGKTTPTSLNSSISNYNKGNLPKTKSKPTVANIVQNVKSTPQQTTVASEPNITNSNRSNVYYNPPTPYEFSVVNPLAVSEYKLQHYNDKTKSYNGVNVNERLKYYKDNLPTVFNQFFEEKDGNFKLKDGKSYLDFQKGYNEFTDETEQLFANEYGFDKEQLAEYKNRINFTDSSKDTSRGKDNKFGEYTSTRSGFQRNVVTPEQLEQLKKEGIFTGRGVLSNPEKAKAILGEDTYNKAILGLDKYKNADYIIGTVNPETPKEKEVVAEEAKQEMTPYENKESNYTNRLPILTPDQSNIAPKYFGTRLRGIQAPWNVANFVSPEASIREINRQTNTARELITSTNPYTSASAIANLQAQENQNINNAVMQTELANQQAQNQTDNINEQRIMQTDLANNRESFAYENRSNIGLDNYYKEWTNFFDRRNKERMVNYNLQNQVNAVNAINPNYNVGFDGSIYQTPEEFSVVANKDGEMFVVDKNGKVVRKPTETTVGNTKTTTTEGDAKAMNGKTKAQEGGLLTSKNFRDFLKRNKKD